MSKILRSLINFSARVFFLEIFETKGKEKKEGSICR